MSSELTLSPLALELLGSKLAPGLSMRALCRDRDRQALLSHWLALAPDCLRSRFFNSPSAEALKARVEAMDFLQTRVVGIFDQGGALICSAQWAEEGPGVAEIAFSTLSTRRGQGLAKIAVGACAIDARERGISKLRLETFRRNVPAKRLSFSLGGQAEPSEEAFPETVVHHIETGQVQRAHFGPRR